MFFFCPLPNNSSFQWVMYDKYLRLYQSRYIAHLHKHPVDWQRISYWRRQCRSYGKILMERNALTLAEHKANMHRVVTLLDGQLVNITERQQQIPLTNG